jgi:FkbM family methyltransferase
VSKKIARLARRLYYKSPLYRAPARLRRDELRLYRQFISSGQLAFDIGANAGVITNIFLKLGARVVAVEPNPGLARGLPDRATVVNAAVGSRAGEAVLHLGVDDEHSTLSEDWLEQPVNAGRWSGTITVPVVTLDGLIDEHGVPAFVKIDAEAYDAEILTGLSQPLPALSFEYQTVMPDVQRKCMDILGDGYEYAITRETRPYLSSWGTPQETRARIATLEGVTWGDVFARRTDRPSAQPR